MRNIYLIARRDYLGYVTSWGFWLGLLLTPLILAAFILAPSLIENNQPVRYYTVIDSNGAFASQLADRLESRRESDVERQLFQLAVEAPEGFDPQSIPRFREAIAAGADVETALEQAKPGLVVSVPERSYQFIPPPAQTEAGLAPYLLGNESIGETGARRLFAALIVNPDTGEVTYLSDDVVNDGLKSAARWAIEDEVRAKVLGAAGLDPADVQAAVDAAPRIIERKVGEGGEVRQVTMADQAPYIAAVAIAFLLWFLIFSVVNYLLSGTIEERSNKIFDTLLTSAKLTQLLTGKLAAVFVLSLTLMSFWVVGGVLVAQVAGGGMPASAAQFLSAFGNVLIQPGILIPTLLSFVLGYLMFGAIFLALGSLCESVQEAQTLMSPLLIILMVPLLFFSMAITDPKSPILAGLSWFPLFTPFLLILRLPNGLPLPEVAGLIGAMALTTVIILWAAMRVYRAGAVHGAGVDSVGRWFKGLVGGGSRKGSG